MVKVRFEKSGLPRIAATIGVSRSATKAVTRAPNAAPMTMPTARSTTLPRSRKVLNSLTMARRFGPSGHDPADARLHLEGRRPHDPLRPRERGHRRRADRERVPPADDGPRARQRARARGAGRRGARG